MRRTGGILSSPTGPYRPNLWPLDISLTRAPGRLSGGLPAVLPPARGPVCPARLDLLWHTFQLLSNCWHPARFRSLPITHSDVGSGVRFRAPFLPGKLPPVQFRNGNRSLPPAPADRAGRCCGVPWWRQAEHCQSSPTTVKLLPPSRGQFPQVRGKKKDFWEGSAARKDIHPRGDVLRACASRRAWIPLPPFGQGHSVA